MKTKILLLFAMSVASCCFVFSQSPQAFKYQAVARDNNGDLLANQFVSFRMGILQGSPTGISVYTETHALTTNGFGLANLNIGDGTTVSGDFASINWSSGVYYLKIEMDPAGGSAYQFMGTSQLLSVPYSMFANNGVGPGAFGQTLLHNGSEWIGNSNLVNDGINVGIGIPVPTEKLQVAGTIHATMDGFMFPDGTMQMSAAETFSLPYDGTTGFSPSFSITNPSGSMAIVGLATDISSGINYGGYFEASRSEGRGVSGMAFGSNGFGVHGHASGQNGLGVLGEATGANGIGIYGIGTAKAGFFEGEVYVEGNVGIGDVTPDQKISVLANYPTTNTVEDLLCLARGSTGTVDIGEGAGIIFRNEVSNAGYALSGRIASIMEQVTSGSSAAGMLLQTRASDGSMNDAIYMNPYNQVGFGTLNPTEELTIENYWPFVGLNNINEFGNAGFVFETQDDFRGWIYYNDADQNLVLNAESGTGWRKDLVIHTNGLVGINTGIPNAQLDVRRDDDTYNYLGYNDLFGSYFFHNEAAGDGDGQAALYAYRTRSAASDGSGYGVSSSNYAMKGYCFWGDLYSFGTAGYNYNDYGRCGGVLGGKNDGSYWGALGYKTSSYSPYGGYFTSYTSGSGKDNAAKTGIGIGAWGDLFGADIHGSVYGAFIEGEQYATYTKGTSFHEGLDVHVQPNGTDVHTVLYTSVSTDATVQTSGWATITGGKANISFDEHFIEAVADNEPIVVTVTPMGISNGFYLSEVNATGFRLEENNEGESNVTVSYIAIGKRKGYENPVLPGEVLKADYTAKLSEGLHNDNALDTDGSGLYYENGRLMTGIHSSMLPEAGKPVIPDDLPLAPVGEVKTERSTSAKGSQVIER